MQFLDVTISPEAVDPDDVGMLEDLVLAALHDAMAQIERSSARRWAASTSVPSAA